ncbi:MAG TPA: IPT/TIG domain-containing protein, partial [Myxococcota bacterium]|nr:IPT/TIG domain-containing protein [Myxococcota bacterium]
MRIAPLLAVVVATLGCSLPEIPGRDDGPDITIRDDVFAPEDVPFTPDGQEPAFSVATVDPSRGPLTGGTRVEIRGTGFVQDARVVFGASDAVDVVVQNERSILATTPANQAGFAAVSVVRPDGVHARLDAGFFY